MKFHVVKLGSRPLLAVPAGVPALWRVAIDCYPAHTRKKRLVRRALHGLALIGIIRWIFPARKLSLPGVGNVDFEGWIATLCDELDEVELQPVLVWPADPGRGRLYVHLLSAKGDKAGFGKLGLNQRNNELIERERKALKSLATMRLTLSRIPRLLASDKLNQVVYLVVEAIPEHARASDWQSDASIEVNIAEYGGPVRVIDRAEVESLPWWPAVRAVIAERTSSIDDVNASLNEGLDVCFAHGDLNCTNVLRDGDDVWLLDWEQSDHNAPALTDQVCVAVDKLWLANSEDMTGNLQKFRDTFPYENNPKLRTQVITALAYLSAAGFPPALAMIDAMYPNT